MASLLDKIVKSAVSSAVKTAASTAKAVGASSGSKTASSAKAETSTASGGGEGVASLYDQQLMSAEDLAAIQTYSAAAKSASAAGDQAGVSSAHAAAEAIRARYGYSGGQLGDQYIPLEGTVTVTAPKADVSGIRDAMKEQMEAAGEQQTSRIDYATAQGITALEQAQREQESQFQTLRDQTDIDERKALDNQALYAEVRGDWGGVGREQYNEVQNTAARNRLAVNRQQVELAAQTRLQMEQLRTEGEFEKADALLSLSQSYLSQLVSLEQWAAEYDLSSAKFQADLDQWREEFQLKAGELLGSYNGQATLAAQKQQTAAEQDRQKVLAEAGEALLKAGILPSAAQLAAMGMTSAQAQAQLRSQSVKSSSTSGSSAKKQDYEGLFTAAGGSVDARSYIANNYKAFGFTASTGLWDAYQTWRAERMDGGLTSLDYDAETERFIWNGEGYDSLQKLLRAIWQTELTDGEAAALEKRFAALGYDIAIP